MSLFPLSDPAGRCRESQGGGWYVTLLKWVPQAQLPLAVGPRPSSSCPAPAPQAKWVLRTSVLNSLSRGPAGKDRVQVTFGPIGSLVTWGVFSEWDLSLPAWTSRNYPRHRGGWNVLEYTLLGSRYSQWPLWENNEISVTLLYSLQKEGICVLLSILPLMRVIWILEGNLLWHKSCREPGEFSS